MHGLPSHINLKFLENKELIQVCVDLHELTLNFEEEISILITSRCTLQTSDGETTDIIDYQRAASATLKLLGAKIVEESHENDGTLALRFSTKDTLTLFDDQSNYESYVISHGQDMIAV